MLPFGIWILAMGGFGSQAPREQAVLAATNLVSATLGVPTGELRVVSVTETIWRDSSLGCAERGHVYTPAIIGGFTVTLQGDSRRYEVHTAGGQAVVCAGGAPTTKAPNDTVRPALDAASHARRHLGTRLGIPPADLVVRRIRPWRALDGTCGPPAGVTQSGATFLVELSREERLYRYRATRESAWPCPDAAEPGKR